MSLDTRRISSAGTYIGVIEGHNLSVSDKGKRCPQATLKLQAAQKYVSSPEELTHFGLTEAGFVDWVPFDEGITAFLTLYNSGEEFTPDTENLNAGQFAKVVGWEKGDFEALTNDSFVNKEIQFHVESQEYQGKTNLRVTWIDVPGASPDRQLKAIDSDTLKSLKARVRGYAKRPAAMSAPRSTVVSAPAAVSAPPTKAAPRPPAPKDKGRRPKVKSEALPPLCTRDEAWDAVYAAKGKLTDDEVTDSFIIATEEVGGGNKLEEDFTPAEWGSVRDRALDSLDRANVVA